MRAALHCLASTRLAVLLLVSLAIAVTAEQLWSHLGNFLSSAILIALCVTLAAALRVHARARAGALGVFHGSLLAALLLALLGQLMRFEGRVEVTTGSAFEAQSVLTTRRGPWHTDNLASEQFAQGEFTVDYSPGNRRGRTSSHVRRADGEALVVGDDRPLIMNGYRFYTTHNKGFAPVLAWSDAQGRMIIGSVHMPSYPLMDWKQANLWQAPSGAPVKLWLRVAIARAADQSWRLRSGQCDCVLIVEIAGQRHEMRPGDRMAMPDGAQLGFLEVRGWMGYRIFFDPTLPWLLLAALISGASLGVHMFRVLGRRNELSIDDAREPASWLALRRAG